MFTKTLPKALFVKFREMSGMKWICYGWPWVSWDFPHHLTHQKWELTSHPKKIGGSIWWLDTRGGGILQLGKLCHWVAFSACHALFITVMTLQISHESFTLHMRGGIGKILHLERNYMSTRHIQYL
jgi:hypothetical protein